MPRLLSLVVLAAGAVSTAPADTRPNVIVILVDDLGWSDLGCYGGEISTPNINGLANSGLRFRQFYNSARCSPTRAALLSGLYTQQVASDPAQALPDLRDDNNLTIAELLKANGYRTYMAGKWHLGAGNLLPENRGFQHVWRFGNGQAHSLNQWNQSLYTLISQNNEIAFRNYTAMGQQFYQTDAIGDYTVDFINHDIAKGDGAPFFIYMAFGAPHFPIGAPAAIADTYTSTYTKGWDVLAHERYDRQMAQGVIDSRYPFTPRGGVGPHQAEPIEEIPAWDSLAADRKADLVRRMSLYAAMIQKVDENIGKVITRLQTAGLLDNTLIFFMSDNGANHEGGRFGTWTGTATGAALTGAALTNMGQPSVNDGIDYGGGWAHLSNTPLRLFKHFTHEGGIRAPFIMNWGARITDHGTCRDEPSHLIDVMATIVDATGVTYPTTFNGHPVLPMEGKSLLPVADGAPFAERSLFVEHELNKMIRKGRWKLVSKNFTLYDGSSPANERELYDMSLDPGESTNVALSHPTLVLEMIDEWNAWGARVGVPAARFFQGPIVSYTPGATQADLFVDTFNRSLSNDIDSSITGVTSNLMPAFAANSTWMEGYEGSGAADCTMVDEAVLKLAASTAAGMSELAMNHNFVEQSIINAGGFSVSLDVLALLTDATDTANRFAGFGVGLTAAQAASGNDINSSTGSQRPIRGNTNTPGVADCFVELDYNKNVKVWVRGVLKASLPVGALKGNLTAAFALSGFGTNNTVSVTVYFNGKRLNADPVTFSWDSANANYIALSGRCSDHVQVDNFAVRKLPIANTLALQYALDKGLDGVESAPDANPDDDSASNGAEWAFGSDPKLSDDLVSGATLTFSNLPAQGFRFAHRRLTGASGVGLSYKYEVSTDLQSWHDATPTEVAVTALPGSPGYEVAELKLPDAEILDRNRLFLRVVPSY